MSAYCRPWMSEFIPYAHTISWSSTLPSLVSLMSPAPDTNLTGRNQFYNTATDSRLDDARDPFPYIFMVPLGPRLVLMTSWSPRAALMLTCRACAALATSALGFSDFTAAIFTACVDTWVQVLRMRRTQNRMVCVS